MRVARGPCDRRHRCARRRPPDGAPRRADGRYIELFPDTGTPSRALPAAAYRNAYGGMTYDPLGAAMAGQMPAAAQYQAYQSPALYASYAAMCGVQPAAPSAPPPAPYP